jgi:hypothetical protein
MNIIPVLLALGWALVTVWLRGQGSFGKPPKKLLMLVFLVIGWVMIYKFVPKWLGLQ